MTDLDLPPRTLAEIVAMIPVEMAKSIDAMLLHERRDRLIARASAEIGSIGA